MSLSRPRPLGRLTWLLAPLAIALVLAGCAGAGATEDVGELSAAGTVELLEDEQDAVLLDVRTPEEVAQGALVGATFIDLQAPDFRERVDQLDRDATYVIYCRSGNRSGQAAEIMHELGFTDLYNAGAYVDLAAVGLPTQP